MLTIKRAKAKAATAALAAVTADGAAAPPGAPPPAPLPLDTSSRVVYVGNLSWEVDEAAMATAFEVRCAGSPQLCKSSPCMPYARHCDAL